ncbi:unnamed protein product [Closterium sp. NIES-65]|nr:unnamed protein product [Closterium sp. NIES-65]
MCASATGVVRVQSRKKAEMYLVRTDGISCTREKVTASTLAFSHPSTQQQMLMWRTRPRTVLLLKKLGTELMSEAMEVARFLQREEGMNVMVEPELHDTLSRMPGFGFLQTFYAQDTRTPGGGCYAQDTRWGVLRPGHQVGGAAPRTPGGGCYAQDTRWGVLRPGHQVGGAAPRTPGGGVLRLGHQVEGATPRTPGGGCYAQDTRWGVLRPGHQVGGVLRLGHQVGGATPRTPGGGCYAQDTRWGVLRPGHQVGGATPRTPGGGCYAQDTRWGVLRPGHQVGGAAPRTPGGGCYAQDTRWGVLRPGHQVGGAAPRTAGGGVLRLGHQVGGATPRTPGGGCYAQDTRWGVLRPGHQVGGATPRTPGGGCYAQDTRWGVLRPGHQVGGAAPRTPGGGVLRLGHQVGGATPRTPGGGCYAQDTRWGVLRPGHQVGGATPRTPGGGCYAQDTRWGVLRPGHQVGGAAPRTPGGGCYAQDTRWGVLRPGHQVGGAAPRTPGGGVLRLGHQQAAREGGLRGVSAGRQMDGDCELTKLHEKVDFVVCLGGDGVILHASNIFSSSVPPIVSFNLGSLGFLTAHPYEQYKQDLKAVIHGQEQTAGVYITLRMRLKCEVVKGGQAVPGKVFDVLNEVVVDRGSNPYLCKIECYERSKLITKVQADGVIVATPTGSTAYSTAAGGSMVRGEWMSPCLFTSPIPYHRSQPTQVHPNVPCMLFTPICPHSLSFRPIILPDSALLELRVPADARSNCWVSFDGKKRQQLSRGDSVRISMSAHPVPTVNKRDQTDDWFASLVRCLNWNERMEQKGFNTVF